MTKRNCTECGTEFTPKKAHAEFCSTPCRKEFNNRRAMRGAQLYDAMMNMRYARKDAADQDIDYSFLCRMAEMFNREDTETRRGRRSYRTAVEVKRDLGAKVNARHGDQAAKHLREVGKARAGAEAAASIANVKADTDPDEAARLLAKAKAELKAKERGRLIGYSL